MMNRTMIRTILCVAVLCVGCDTQSATCDSPLDIIFAVDVSASTSLATFNQAQTFLSDLVGTFTISTTAAQIVVFGFDSSIFSTGVTQLDQAGAQSLTGVRQQISNLIFAQGSTLITVAITEAGNVFTNSVSRGVPRVVVFVSDGVHNGGSSLLIGPAADLRSDFSTRVVGLGIGPPIDIDTAAFDILTGSSNQLVVLTFTNTSCTGGGDSDSDDDEDDDDSGDSGSDTDGGAACDTELSRATKLICGTT